MKAILLIGTLLMSILTIHVASAQTYYTFPVNNIPHEHPTRITHHKITHRQAEKKQALTLRKEQHPVRQEAHVAYVKRGDGFARDIY
ncbi:hypothetical protein GA0116948_10695 [Chitinophaga costaii]|uniref:Uncharacterized protein n=1 Tax=Chitinophaga costaii TaxID=1335309 RepID=A0A1C4DT75_9BACT|nr:hypothetical protein [Chitinophaga costaii]SCC34543.1 hypothetical protein GA0116948_10695 [Chitinophaga costaii]